jgi:hypothetical protein
MYLRFDALSLSVSLPYTAASEGQAPAARQAPKAGLERVFARCASDPACSEYLQGWGISSAPLSSPSHNGDCNVLGCLLPWPALCGADTAPVSAPHRGDACAHRAARRV